MNPLCRKCGNETVCPHCKEQEEMEQASTLKGLLMAIMCFAQAGMGIYVLYVVMRATGMLFGLKLIVQIIIKFFEFGWALP